MPRKRTSQSTGAGGGLKRFFLSAFVVLSFLAYFFHQKLTSQASAASGSGPSGNSLAPTLDPTQSSVVTTQGIYKNGTFTGPEVNAYYGLVQVQVTIQNGQIAQVQFLDYPHDRQTSQMINTQVMPWLQQEAIQAQSANVDLISGATLTSEAFAQSLQTALQSAKN